MALPDPIRPKPYSAAALGTTLGRVARSFHKGEQGNRMLRGLSAGGRAFLGVVRRVARVLWLEITGSLFLWLAVIGAAACWREYRAFTAGTIGPARAVVAAVFTLVFAYFGLSSFRNAHKT